MRNSLLIATLLAASSAVHAGPSLWQIETECANNKAVAEIAPCTRAGLTEAYADRWQSVPQVQELLSFIDFKASEAAAGKVSEPEAKFEIARFSAYHQQQVMAAQNAQTAAQQEAAQQAAAAQIAQEQAAAAEKAAQQQATLNLGLQLLQLGQPRTLSPAASPPVNCRSTSNPFTGVTTTCN